MNNRKIGVSVILFCLVLLAASSAWAHECEFGPWKTKRNPTCRLEGLDFRYCKHCDHWEKRYIDKLPHTPDEWKVSVEPTCTARGSKTATCTACNHPMRQYLDMLPHQYGEMTVETEPTCRKTGTGVRACVDCGRKKRETLERIDHDWAVSKTIKEATCNRAGSGNFTCQSCGRTQKMTIDKLEHEWNEWTITREPSGQKKGAKTSTCKLCGKEEIQYFYWEGTLYQDMEPNQNVIHLQEMLRDLGYYNGNIRSGAFGALTGRAVANFQKDHGMPATQVADLQTRALIEEEWKNAFGTAVQE